MQVNLFGVRYRRSQDVDWYDNPHKAIARCRELGLRKITWLSYNPRFLNRHYNSTCWQVVYNLSEFERRILPGFAPADSPIYNPPAETIPPDKLPGAIRKR